MTNLRFIGVLIFLSVFAFFCATQETYWIVIKFPDALAREQARELSVFVIQSDPVLTCEGLLQGAKGGYVVQQQTVLDLSSPKQEFSLKQVAEGPALILAEVKTIVSNALVSSAFMRSRLLSI